MRTRLVVNTAALSKNLTVLDTVKQELGITDSVSDARIEALICTASDIIAAHCDRVFARETVTEYFYPDRRGWCERWDELVLARTPIESITSVSNDDSALDTADYSYDANSGILFRLVNNGQLALNWWASHAGVQVQYVGGYALLDGLPRGVERAAVLLCKEYYYQTARDPRIRSESTPNIYTVDYQVGAIGNSNSLPPDIVALLAPYKRISA